MIHLPILPNSGTLFPPTNSALEDPNGLLAMGGTLSTERLIAAYQQGIFPWYEEGEPILWWSPDPRSVIFIDEVKVSRSLYKTIKSDLFRVSFDRRFEEVVDMCANAP